MKILSVDSLKKFVNSVLPGQFYIPSFQVGDYISLKPTKYEGLSDIPRFENDTLYSILPKSKFKIEAISYGYYKQGCSSPEYAVFQHDKVTGKPHYEVTDVDGISFFDNYNKRHILRDSRIHIPVDIVEINFVKSSKQ